MTVSPRPTQPNRAIAIILVDDDLIFRTGLRVWLEQHVGIRVVGETDREWSALQLVRSHLGLTEPLSATDPDITSAGTQSEDSDDSDLTDTRESVDSADSLVAVVSLTLARSPARPTPSSDADRPEGLRLCRALKAAAPTLPVVLIGPAITPLMLNRIQQAGASAYGLKAGAPELLLQAVQRAAIGETAWPPLLIPRPASGSSTPYPAGFSGSEGAMIARPFALLRRNLRRSGVRQIEVTLEALLDQLQHPMLVGIDRWVVEGRCRELKAARWLVNHLLATPILMEGADEGGSESIDPSALGSETGAIANPSPRSLPRRATARPAPVRSTAGNPEAENSATAPPTPVPAVSAIVGAGVEATLFDGVLMKLQSRLQNQTDVPLEIDILREEKKRELLYLVVRGLMRLLDELRQSQVTPRQVLERRSLILRDLWQSVADDFFGKYYAVQVESLEVEVVTVLSAEADAAQTAILDWIPYATELLAHLLFLDPLQVDSIPHAAGTPEAMMRAELLLDHLVIQVANSVIQPLLNQLGDVETIKQGFYDQSLMSSREIARFRNDLSWRYRLDQSVGEPTNIFESRYRLFIFQGNSIKQTFIYAPRRQELEALTGLPFWVTLALELRDAIAPRVRAVVSFVGSGAIYILTDVIGRGIGLIVRGIIKGIGSAWQDARLGRDTNQRRL